MGITVIPALASGTLPATAATAATSADGAAGGFAALLNGELLSLMGAAAEQSGITLADSDDQVVAKDNGDDSGGAADASLLASLFGHPAGTDMPTRSLRTSGGSTSDSERIDTGAIGTQTTPEAINTKADERAAARANPQDTGSAFEKLMQGGTAATSSANNTATSALRSSAANIAGEGPSNEAPPVVASNLATNAAVTPAASTPSNDQRSAVNAHLHSSAWPQQFGEKIVWLARNDQQSAQLNINPAQLGPVQITLNLSGDQASIAFASPHAEVRQAIESAMPQLKEMLASAGINLGQSNVGANLSQQRADNPFSDANGTRSTDENAILPANDKAANTAGTAVLHRGRGLVDLFA